jgi:hypothetical protein
VASLENRMIHAIHYSGLLLSSGDRCYDFLNIFALKFSEKIGVFDSKQS